MILNSLDVHKKLFWKDVKDVVVETSGYDVKLLHISVSWWENVNNVGSGHNTELIHI